jgi:hypothetical protein
MVKFFVALFLISLFASVANAGIVQQKLVGQGSLYYFLLHIYDTKLYSEDGMFSFDKPFSLRLAYKRKISGEEIAARSIEEIRKLGFKDEEKLTSWGTQMDDIFPDVNDGVSITGIYTPNQSTDFYSGGVKIGTIKDPEFGKWFFGIWLSQNTSQPKLRQALLGRS